MKQNKQVSKFAIGRLKKRALDLRITNQITPYMCSLVLTADYNDVDYIKFLTELFEHYLRVRGYYKKNKEIAVQVDQAISNSIKEFNERRNI